MATCSEPRLPISRRRSGDDQPQRGGILSWTTGLIRNGEHAVPVRVLTPAEPSGWVVWAHGGSWARGSAEQWHAPCADLAVRSSCVVVSVDYRLAPRHLFPAPVDDVVTAMAWAQQQMVQVGTDPALLAVGGDSAGGTLAACAALAWRDQGHPLGAQVLAYPPLDPQCSAASYTMVRDSSRTGPLCAQRGPCTSVARRFQAPVLPGTGPLWKQTAWRPSPRRFLPSATSIPYETTYSPMPSGSDRPTCHWPFARSPTLLMERFLMSTQVR